MENPQAFPGAYKNNDETVDFEPGMTLRDYLAGQMLAGMIANSYSRAITDDAIAKEAYSIADAMLKERSK